MWSDSCCDWCVLSCIHASFWTDIFESAQHQRQWRHHHSWSQHLRRRGIALRQTQWWPQHWDQRWSTLQRLMQCSQHLRRRWSASRRSTCTSDGRHYTSSRSGRSCSAWAGVHRTSSCKTSGRERRASDGRIMRGSDSSWVCRASVDDVVYWICRVRIASAKHGHSWSSTSSQRCVCRIDHLPAPAVLKSPVPVVRYIEPAPVVPDLPALVLEDHRIGGTASLQHSLRDRKTIRHAVLRRRNDVRSHSVHRCQTRSWPIPSFCRNHVRISRVGYCRRSGAPVATTCMMSCHRWSWECLRAQARVTQSPAFPLQPWDVLIGALSQQGCSWERRVQGCSLACRDPSRRVGDCRMSEASEHASLPVPRSAHRPVSVRQLCDTEAPVGRHWYWSVCCGQDTIAVRCLLPDRSFIWLLLKKI